MRLNLMYYLMLLLIIAPQIIAAIVIHYPVPHVLETIIYYNIGIILSFVFLHEWK